MSNPNKKPIVDLDKLSSIISEEKHKSSHNYLTRFDRADNKLGTSAETFVAVGEGREPTTPDPLSVPKIQTDQIPREANHTPPEPQQTKIGYARRGRIVKQASISLPAEYLIMADNLMVQYRRQTGAEINRSEIIRAGISCLAVMNTDQFISKIKSLEPIKPGRKPILEEST
jgi:hypothetical protein